MEFNRHSSKGQKFSRQRSKRIFFRENMLVYLAFDMISSSKVIHLLELRFRKTFCASAQRISAEKYPFVFSRQIEAIVYMANGITVSAIK